MLFHHQTHNHACWHIVHSANKTVLQSLQVATLVKADWLFLLTDVDCLYTANPAINPEATPIPEVHDITKLQVSYPSVVWPCNM